MRVQSANVACVKQNSSENALRNLCFPIQSQSRWGGGGESLYVLKSDFVSLHSLFWLNLFSPHHNLIRCTSWKQIPPSRKKKDKIFSLKMRYWKPSPDYFDRSSTDFGSWKLILISLQPANFLYRCTLHCPRSYLNASVGKSNKSKSF